MSPSIPVNFIQRLILTLCNPKLKSYFWQPKYVETKQFLVVCHVMFGQKSMKGKKIILIAKSHISLKALIDIFQSVLRNLEVFPTRKIPCLISLEQKTTSFILKVSVHTKSYTRNIQHFRSPKIRWGKTPAVLSRSLVGQPWQTPFLHISSGHLHQLRCLASGGSNSIFETH